MGAGDSPVIGTPPGRHRNPMSQQSTVIPPYENVSWGDDEPPPLPPRSHPHSVMYPPPVPPPPENISSQFSSPPGYTLYDPISQQVF